MAEERVQKLLAAAGIGSRRFCETLINDGRVKVNGRVIGLGDKADPQKDSIVLDGKLIRVSTKRIYIALNKPKGYLSDVDETHPRPTVNDLVGLDEPLFAVGRLDLESEGLILMTNDGELSQHVMHPKYEVEKTYIATIDGKIGGNVCRRLVTQGVQLDDGLVKLDHCAIIDANRDQTIVKVVLHSGKNRIVRRIFGAIGYPVRRLVRTQIGPIKLGDLKSGTYRVLSQVEVRSLQKEVGL